MASRKPLVMSSTGRVQQLQAADTIDLPWQLVRVVGISIDGGGSVPATGVKGYVIVPFSGTIIGWNIVGDVTGSAVVDVWKVAYGSSLPTVANTIAASAKPTLSSAKINKDATVTGWTTAVTANDIFGFNLDSISTITKLNVEIVIQG